VNNNHVLILGARSDIAKAIAHRFASEGSSIDLAARGSESLLVDKADLEVRYNVEVTLHDFDVLDTQSHASFVETLPVMPTTVVCVVGYMGSQADSEKRPDAAVKVIRTNFEGPASIFLVLASHFEARGSGTLVGISSVAGLRGRASNYIYGSAKAGFSAFLSGLRNRLTGSGVHVVTVLPGFVATRMTEGMDLPSRLTAQPEEVAKAVWTAVDRKRDIIYVRSVWRFIMIIICAIPEKIFKRLSL